MRKLVYVLLLISTYSLSTRAQSANFGNASNFFNLRPMNFPNGERDFASHLKILFSDKGKELNGKTISKMTDIKSLVGKEICLRPDYGGQIKVGNQFVKVDEVLMVAKAKSSELTVMRNDEKLVIPKFQNEKFMLVSDRDEMAHAIEAQIQAEKEAAERAKREAEQAAQQTNLNAYYESLKNMPSMDDGPIVIDTQRAYDGTTPYWKKLFSDKEVETFLDEKFVINSKAFRKAYASNKDRNNEALTQLEKLSTMQTDTFGIIKNGMINLRTGDIFKTYIYMEGDIKWKRIWESVTYLENLKSLPPVEYDGTESLTSFLGDFDRAYRDRYINALIGERVFLLDEQKYDIITDIEEDFSNNGLVYFKNHEPLKEWQWKEKCISVKWYEQLQKKVGKKVVMSSKIRYYGRNDISTTWREDLADLETETIERLEIKDGRFLIHLVGKEFPVDALRECKLLAYPINVEEEWKLEKMTGQSRLNNGQSYLDFDVVLATTPKKPSSVKKQETEIDTWARDNSKKYDELRNHQYIGTLLSSFLSKWPHAKLVNTTVNGGVKIEIYHLQDYMYDYQIIFRNGKCISQTKL